MDREPGLQILLGTRIGNPGFDPDRIQINLPMYVNDEICALSGSRCSCEKGVGVPGFSYE